MNSFSPRTHNNKLKVIKLFPVPKQRFTRCLYLLAVEAFLGKLLLMAGRAVHVFTLGQEALRADWLVTFNAFEAVLVPHLVLVLHVLVS